MSWKIVEFTWFSNSVSSLSIKATIWPLNHSNKSGSNQLMKSSQCLKYARPGTASNSPTALSSCSERSWCQRIAQRRPRANLLNSSSNQFSHSLIQQIIRSEALLTRLSNWCLSTHMCIRCLRQSIRTTLRAPYKPVCHHFSIWTTSCAGAQMSLRSKKLAPKSLISKLLWLSAGWPRCRLSNFFGSRLWYSRQTKSQSKNEKSQTNNKKLDQKSRLQTKQKNKNSKELLKNAKSHLVGYQQSC